MQTGCEVQVFRSLIELKLCLRKETLPPHSTECREAMSPLGKSLCQVEIVLVVRGFKLRVNVYLDCNEIVRY